EEFEAGHVGKLRLCWEIGNGLVFQRAHELQMRARGFAEEAAGLLPLTLFADVGIMTVAESEGVEQMALVLKVMTQPPPRGVVRRQELRQRRRAELRMRGEEGND